MRDIVWRETWPGEGEPDDLQGIDGDVVIGRIYADVDPQTDEKRWNWYNGWGGPNNAGMDLSRRGAMEALEKAYEEALAEDGEELRDQLDPA